MNKITSKIFITDNFLLNSEEAIVLYHEYAKDMPLIDYHNHLSPKQIAEDRPLGDISDVWLKGDHYKWRAMRANGIEEEYITGDKSNKDKFHKWAETIPNTLRNPLFHWTQLELKRYFDIDEILQPNTAENIYKTANTILANKTPSQLLKEMNVEIICTTDDPTDSLEYHQQIAKQNIFTKVLPAFRSDSLFAIELDDFKYYIKKLEACVDFSIKNIHDFLKAVDQRLYFFNENGCRLSDFGLGGPLSMVDFEEDEIVVIFNKKIKHKTLTSLEVNKYQSCLFLHLGKKYHELGWVQQFHLGAIRNNNKRLNILIGSDSGCDSISDYSFADFMSKLFDKLDQTNQLAKTISYNLNPSHNEVFASMMSNFQTGGVPSKMQWGSGWWFLDQKDGMEKQMNALSNIGLLSKFIGMLTDSRSFLSFPRHEYFRRILCDLMAEDIKKGIVPNDISFIGKMIQDICYNNAVKYFNFNDIRNEK